MNSYISSHADTAKTFGSAQIKWVAEVALNFSSVSDKSDWAVIFFTHTFSGLEATTIGTIIESFMLGNDANISGYDTSYFVGQGAMNVCGVFHGHDHDDLYTNTIVGSASNINYVGFDNSFTDISTELARDRIVLDELDTENEYCVSFISIDTQNKKIYETRMGRLGYANYLGEGQGRRDCEILATDPNTNEKKMNRSFSYGKQSSDHHIDSGIDYLNKNAS